MKAEQMALEIGDFFKETEKQTHVMEEEPKLPKKPFSNPPMQKPKKRDFSYADYLRFHKGNKAAALYWFRKNEKPLK